MTITILDNMEYSTNALAQSQYVTNSSHVYGVEEETADYVSRVVSDGGIIVSVSDIDAAIAHAKANGYYSSLKGWYSPQFGFKNGGSNHVSKYYDLSPNNNDALQATYANQPVWTNNVRNGRASLVFTASSPHYLKTMGYSSSVPQPLTQFAVVNQGSGRGAWTDGIASDKRDSLLAHWSSPYYYDMYGEGLEFGSTVDSVNNSSVLAGIFNGSSSILYRNGTSIATGNIGTQSLTGLTLGATYELGVVMQGNLYDVIVLSGDQTSLVSTITSFLNIKWAIY